MLQVFRSCEYPSTNQKNLSQPCPIFLLPRLQQHQQPPVKESGLNREFGFSVQHGARHQPAAENPDEADVLLDFESILFTNDYASKLSAC